MSAIVDFFRVRVARNDEKAPHIGHEQSEAEEGRSENKKEKLQKVSEANKEAKARKHRPDKAKMRGMPVSGDQSSSSVSGNANDSLQCIEEKCGLSLDMLRP